MIANPLKASTPGQRPRMLMCYLCGREYGTASLPIHIPQCKKKWLQKEAMKPKSERRPLPREPTVSVGKGGDYDAFNDAAFNTFNTEAMVKCENCGRTFKEDSYKIHARSCKPGSKGASKSIQAAVARKFTEGSKLEDNVAKSKEMRARSDSRPGTANRPRTSNGKKKSLKNGVLLKKKQQQQPPPASDGTITGSFCVFCGNPGVFKFCAHCGKVNPLHQDAAPNAVAASATGVTPPPATKTVSFSPQSPTTGSPSSGSGNSGEDDGSFSPHPPAGPSPQIHRPSPQHASPAPPSSSAFSDPEGSMQIQLSPCSICGRSFKVDRLAKHEAVCRKSAAKKAKSAAAGSSPAQKRNAYDPMAAAKAKPKAKGAASSSAFRDNIRYAKKLTQMVKQGKSISSLPPPPKSENPDYVGCPHCGRRFNQQAAERHIPRCANTVNKPKPPPTHNRYANGGGRVVGAGTRPMPTGGVARKKMPTPRGPGQGPGGASPGHYGFEGKYNAPRSRKK